MASVAPRPGDARDRLRWCVARDRSSPHGPYGSSGGAVPPPTSRRLRSLARRAQDQRLSPDVEEPLSSSGGADRLSARCLGPVGDCAGHHRSTGASSPPVSRESCSASVRRRPRRAGRLRVHRRACRGPHRAAGRAGPGGAGKTGSRPCPARAGRAFRSRAAVRRHRLARRSPRGSHGTITVNGLPLRSIGTGRWTGCASATWSRRLVGCPQSRGCRSRSVRARSSLCSAPRGAEGPGLSYRNRPRARGARPAGGLRRRGPRSAAARRAPPRRWCRMARAERRRAGGTTRSRGAEMAGTTRRRPPGEREPPIRCSRPRNGGWPLSARPFGPLRARRSGAGAISRVAAPCGAGRSRSAAAASPGSPMSPMSGRHAACLSRRRCGTSPERDPVPVHGAPWPVPPPADRNAHPVRMPQIARPRRAAAPVASEGRAERRAPAPDGPVRDVDPAPERALLDDAQSGREAGAEPHDAGDDRARDATAAVAGADRHASRRPWTRRPGCNRAPP